MIKLKYQKEINASADVVFKTMLGLDQKATYEQWTAVFNPTSTYEGKWEMGEKIYFVATDDQGKKQGLVSEIAECIPGRFVSIRHYGILDGENETIDGPEVEKWAGGLENYSFEENEGVTTVTTETDSFEEYREYFDKTWPKALEVLKEIVEKRD